MLTGFFLHLKSHRLPVSTRELLTLLEALEKRVVSLSLDDFYVLSRACFVKDEQHFDRFDLAFASYFKGIETIFDIRKGIPEEWLRKEFERHLSEEDKQRVQALGGWDKLMETLKQRLEEQRARHQGGSKWIGTGGTSPFGAYGYNPEGIRIGQEGGGSRSAVKVWDERTFRNLDGDVELNTRNIKVALRRLRRFAREGAAEELDLDATIRGTARQGFLDIHMRPERHNAVKVLLFLDVGGSMDPYVKLVEELFSAATGEFKNLEFFYFHNCLYESVWQDNRRRMSERTPTWDVLHKFGHDYKVVFVGDAAMSPYEIAHPGGSVEHFNAEAGAVWLQRVVNTYPATVWLNPEPERGWDYTQSNRMVRQIFNDRMYPLTLAGLDAATRELTRKHG